MKYVRSCLMLLVALTALSVIAVPQAADSRTTIKAMQLFGDRSGIVLTDRSLLRTDDDGASWSELGLPTADDEILAAAGFNTLRDGWVFIARPASSRLAVVETNDAGASWNRREIELPMSIAADADLTNFTATAGDSQAIIVKFTLASSSN